MRSVLLSMSILMFAACVSRAQETEPTSPPKMETRQPRVMQSAGIGKYSRMLGSMVTAAEGMDISGEQKEKIATIRADYIEPMATEETRFRKLHSQIMKMLEDPAFDAAEVKKEIEKADAINKKIADKYVDGLASLRDTLGLEKYTEVNKSAFIYRQDLIQMRRSEWLKQRSTRYHQGVEAQQSPAPDGVEDSDNADKAKDADNKE